MLDFVELENRYHFMLPLQLQTVQICDPIVLSFPKMFQRHLEFKRSCCCVLFCSNLSPIISNNKTCLWFRVFIVGKSWIFEVLRKSPILWDFPNIKRGLCLANYFKSRFIKMAEIGVNCAFAVIGNTPYLSNVQNLACTFFPARKICLSSKLFNALNVEHQRSVLAQFSK